VLTGLRAQLFRAPFLRSYYEGARKAGFDAKKASQKSQLTDLLLRRFTINRKLDLRWRGLQPLAISRRGAIS
jgi:hypothetical protein